MQGVYRFMIIIIFVFSGIYGCKGEKGEPGIAGPNGDPGSANVYYSNWFSPSVWQGENTNWYFDTLAPTITQSIIDSGVVLAYVQIDGDSVSTRPLPTIPTAELIFAWNYVIPIAGKIRFTCVNNSDYVPSLNTKFRYVVIPGGAGIGKHNLGYLYSYEALRKLYNIAE